MRQLLSVLALIFINASLASAQTATLYTGDHEGFTRIYIDFSDSFTHAIEEHDGKLILRTSENFSASTDDFWTRISDRRVKNLSSNEDTVSFEVACACKVTLSSPTRAGIAIDISDEDTSSGQIDTIFLDFSGQERTPEEVEPRPGIAKRTATFIPLTQGIRLPYGSMTTTSDTFSPTKEESTLQTSTVTACPKGLDPSQDWPSGEDYSQVKQSILTASSEQQGLERTYLNLARLNMAWGFFEEANSILMVQSSNRNGSDDLRAVLQVVRSEGAEKSIPSQWRDCGTAAHFWLTLQNGRLGAVSEAEQRDLEWFYLSLPNQLKSILESRWKLISPNGHLTLAASSTARDEASTTTQASSVRAELMRATETGQPLSQAFLDLADSIAFEMRDKNTLDEFNELRIRFYLSQEQYQTAARLVRSLTILERKTSMSDAYILSLMEHEEQSLLLREYYADEPLPVSPSVRDKLTAHLGSLGFLSASGPTSSPVTQNTSLFAPRDQYSVSEAKRIALATTQIRETLVPLLD